VLPAPALAAAAPRRPFEGRWLDERPSASAKALPLSPPLPHYSTDLSAADAALGRTGAVASSSFALSSAESPEVVNL